MDNIVFGQRLKKARTMRRLTLDQLCERMSIKISKPALSKYESGKMAPSDDKLEALAEALNVDVSFFSRPVNDDIEKCQINFRKKSTMTKGESKALEVSVLDKVERYLYVHRLLADIGEINANELPVRKPVKNRQEARERAMELRKTWFAKDGLDCEAPIADVQALLETHGIMVLPITVESDSFDGLSGRVANSNEIFIAIKKNTEYIERRRLTTLHELGHQAMDLSDLSPKEQEGLCNEFANEMLIPSDKFRSLFKFTSINQVLINLRPIQTSYGISIDALMKKAHSLGMISNSTYTYFNIYKNTSPSFGEAVRKPVYKESPQYDKFSWWVMRAFALNLIDLDKAEQLLYDSSEEVRADLKAMS